MSPRLNTSVLTGSERHEAMQMGAHRYAGCAQYKGRKEGLFGLLDAAVTAMTDAKFLNPYDGRVIGGFATQFVCEDTAALEWLQKRKYAELDDAAKKADLLKYIGIFIAEDYLRARRREIPSESRIAVPGRMKTAIGGIFKKFKDDVAELVQADADNVPPRDMVDMEGNSVTFTLRERTDQLADFAIELITDQLGTYESVVPATDAEEDVPDEVERRAMAQAAFMRLHAEDLEEIAVEADAENEGAQLNPADFPNKAALAHALGVRFSDDINRVAELVLSKEAGNPEYGLITRLLPLKDVPDLPTIREAFEDLQGHYIEVRTAVFFLFGAVHRQGDTLRIEGRIRSFTVNPAEAGGATTMNPRPHTQDVTITLRRGQAWAEVNTRRASDAYIIRAVLRRTGEVVPAAAPRPPAPLQRDPFSRWDPRTIWMLDFMRRDLHADDLKLDNTLLATFRTPADPLAAVGRRRRPRVDSVQLRGTQLHEHREACLRIVEGSHLQELEIRVRFGRNDDITAALIRFRILWESDHLAIMTGVARGERRPNPYFHRGIVDLVRAAAERELPEQELALILRNIERIASETEPDEGAPEFFAQAPAG